MVESIAMAHGGRVHEKLGRRFTIYAASVWLLDFAATHNRVK
jgi:hypothetical protein